MRRVQRVYRVGFAAGNAAAGRPGGATGPRTTRCGRALAANSGPGHGGTEDVMSDATVSPLPAAGVRRAGRQRRPTGAPPPLPRRLAVTTTAWVLLAAITVTSAFL